LCKPRVIKNETNFIEFKVQQDSDLNLTYINIVNNKRQNVEFKSSPTSQNTCAEWGIVSHEAHMASN
jgi:hypothetical protein